MKGCSAGTALSPKEQKTKAYFAFLEREKEKGANLQTNDHEKENEYEEFLKIFEKSHSSVNDDTPEDTPAIHRKQPLQLHEQGFFAEDAYARGLYHYPEETKDDLMLSGVIAIGISAALVVFGIYNIVCGVMTEAKKAKS